MIIIIRRIGQNKSNLFPSTKRIRKYEKEIQTKYKPGNEEKEYV